MGEPFPHKKTENITGMVKQLPDFLRTDWMQAQDAVRSPVYKNTLSQYYGLPYDEVQNNINDFFYTQAPEKEETVGTQDRWKFGWLQPLGSTIVKGLGNKADPLKLVKNSTPTYNPNYTAAGNNKYVKSGYYNPIKPQLDFYNPFNLV